MRTLLLVLLLLLPSTASAQGFAWAPGVLFTVNAVGDRETVDVIGPDGIVYTVEDVSSDIQPVVETHYALGGPNWQAGPFVAAALGDTIVDSIGVGILGGMKDRFQVGVGYWVTPRAQVRRSDFIPGFRAPRGYDEVQYVTKSVGSLAIMATIQITP